MTFLMISAFSSDCIFLIYEFRSIVRHDCNHAQIFVVALIDMVPGDLLFNIGPFLDESELNPEPDKIYHIQIDAFRS